MYDRVSTQGGHKYDNLKTVLFSIGPLGAQRFLWGRIGPCFATQSCPWNDNYEKEI